VLGGPDFDGGVPSEETIVAALGATEPRRSRDFAGERFSPLPGAAQEAEEIAKKMQQVTPRTGARATEQAVKQARGPLLLHVATHGFFETDQKDEHALDGGFAQEALGRPAPAATPNLENPLLRSGLALAGANRLHSGGEDGILTALEVSGLDLWGTKLVVLSACETGVGDLRNGEGVYGLRRALAIAGAESQVMSLWNVHDAATRELMGAYYDGLLAGQGRSEALRQAQLTMLSNPARGHPYYWAAFIASGNWLPIEFPSR